MSPANNRPVCLALRVVAALLLATTLAGCRTTPITGRRQVLLLPEPQEVALGREAFQETKASEPASTNVRHIALVERVGQRIAEAADRPDYDWEFHVIASPAKNAFCLPGGKVAVYEGVLPICRNEAGLAVVMAHEIAHAIARHGGERMSHSLTVEGARHAVDYFMKEKEERHREMVMKAYGVGAKYGVVLPYSRKHETEADHIGLMLMAKAGYDPAEAPRFWERFSEASQNGDSPQFLSTHPSDARRTQDLLALLPEAQLAYQQSATPSGLGEFLVGPPPEGLAAPAAAAQLQPLTLAPQNVGPRPPSSPWHAAGHATPETSTH